MPDLACLDQLPDRAGDVLDRHVRVDPVLVEEVDAIGPEPLRATPSATCRMCAGPAVEARSAGRRASKSKPNLVAITTLSAHGRERLADEFLVGEGPRLRPCRRT